MKALGDEEHDAQQVLLRAPQSLSTLQRERSALRASSATHWPCTHAAMMFAASGSNDFCWHGPHAMPPQRMS